MTTLFQKANNNVSNTLIFDIETVPLLDSECTEIQREYVNKRLAQRLKKEPELDPIKERRKIMALDPLVSRIACIGLFFPEVKLVQMLMDESEEKMLKEFWGILAGFSGVFVSFNGKSFDIPYILRRSMLHEVEPTNRDFLNYNAYNPLPEHFDVMLQISGRDGYISLEQACHFFGFPSPKDGDVAAEGVEVAFREGRWDDIKKYCERDLRSTYSLYMRVRKYVSQKR